MMVQHPGKRSYFYFLSFAKGQKKWHGGPPPQQHRGSCLSKTKKLANIWCPQPAWDNTIHDLSVWKLSAAELEAKKKAYKSSLDKSSTRSSVTSTAKNCPPCLDADDRSGQSSQDGSIGPAFDFAQACLSSETDFANHKKSGRATKEDVKKLNLKVSVNGASKSCCPVKRFTNNRTISRFGKENRILKSVPSATKTKKCGESTPLSAGTTYVIYNGTKTTYSPTSKAFGAIVDSSHDQSIVQPVFESLNQKTILEEVQTREQAACSFGTTVDFEDEVNLFEAEKKQRLEQLVSSVTKSRRRISYRRPRVAVVGKKPCKRIQELDGTRFIRLKLPLNAPMDKSSPTRYTHQPSFRGGVIDSSDDSVSGPLENLRWQKSPPSAAKHRRHHSQRTPDAKGHHPAEKVQSFSWNPAPQTKEVVNLKGETNISDTSIQSSRSGRTKVVKQDFGNVPKRTSPIMEWNGDLEEDSDDQFSHQQDFQQYMVMCQLDLMKEFKNLKLSLSRQIVNLQLDVDKILANQKAASSKGFQVLPPHRPGSGAEGQFLDLVDQNEELPAYSSLKFKQDLIKPASSSSEESYHIPSSKFDSHYNEEQKGTHFDSWPQEEIHYSMTSHKSFAPPAQSHVFRNLQNNPIYHVQTSSDKRGGSSDSDISSMELTQLNYREALGSLLETKPESEARQCLTQDQLDTVGVSSKGARSQSVTRLQRKKSNGNSLAVPSGTYGELSEIGKTAISAGNQSHDLSYRESKLDTNGHTRSQQLRSGRPDEQSRTSDTEATLAQMLQSGSLKGPRKDEISMSNLLGTYTAKARGSHVDVGPDAEPHLGTPPGRNSPRPAEKKSRSARPLFAEESGKQSWTNSSTTSPTSTYGREPLNQQPCNRKAGAEQGRSTYSSQEPQNQQYGKAGAEERQPMYTREESQGQHYDKAAGDHGRSTYSRAEPQSQHYGKAEAEQEKPVYTREETQNQQYGRAEAEQGRPTHAREQQSSRLYGQLAAEQGRTGSQISTIEKQGEGEPYKLRGWAAAFLDPPSEITNKTQKITLQTGSPKTDYHSSSQDSPTEQSLVQESPERERRREKENGNQYAVRQFSGKSSKGGCAWTVSEPASSPNNSQKESPANGTGTTKGRQKHHYAADNP